MVYVCVGTQMQDTPLHLAALGGYDQTVQILIDNNGNISSPGQVISMLEHRLSFVKKSNHKQNNFILAFVKANVPGIYRLHFCVVIELLMGCMIAGSSHAAPLRSTYW